MQTDTLQQDSQLGAQGGYDDGNRGRDLATRFEHEALAALRQDLGAARGLPAPYREMLLDELALLIDASRRHLAAVRPRGALTRRGVPLAAIQAYGALQGRVERVLRLLGLLDQEPEGQSLSPLERSREVRKLIQEGKL